MLAVRGIAHSVEGDDRHTEGHIRVKDRVEENRL